MSHWFPMMTAFLRTLCSTWEGEEPAGARGEPATQEQDFSHARFQATPSSVVRTADCGSSATEKAPRGIVLDLSTGKPEGNNMIKAPRRCAYGFRDTQHLFSKIYGNSRIPSKLSIPQNAGLNHKTRLPRSSFKTASTEKRSDFSSCLHCGADALTTDFGRKRAVGA